VGGERERGAKVRKRKDRKAISYSIFFVPVYRLSAK